MSYPFKDLKYDVINVTSHGPRNGKTTVVGHIALESGKVAYSTSSIVAEEMIWRGYFPDLTVEQMVKDRLIDPQKYRAELIEVGLSMNKFGIFPSVIALSRGFNIIEGARVAAEVVGLQNACKMVNMSLCHIHLVRDSDIKDSTQSDELAKLADHVIDNKSTLQDLFNKINKLVF